MIHAYALLPPRDVHPISTFWLHAADGLCGIREDEHSAMHALVQAELEGNRRELANEIKRDTFNLMRIVYDDAKRRSNIATHGGLDFADLDVGFFLGSSIVPAKKGRFMAIGRFRNDIIAVVFAKLGVEGVSVISMRPASAKERKIS